MVGLLVATLYWNSFVELQFYFLKKTRGRDTEKKGKTLDAFHFSKLRSKCNIKMMLILYKLAALHQTRRTYCTT